MSYLSIREHYSVFGIKETYESLEYDNPHAPMIQQLIEDNHTKLPLDNVLDLSCGDGIVTKCLIKLGYNNITGTDPYLHERYSKETGQECLNLSFQDIVIGKLTQNFSCIICSFALHLCEKSMLHNLLWQLSLCTSTLVVISPSKFPLIGNANVERFAVTTSGKRVHFRIYNLKDITK